MTYTAAVSCRQLQNNNIRVIQVGAFQGTTNLQRMYVRGDLVPPPLHERGELVPPPLHEGGDLVPPPLHEGGDLIPPALSTARCTTIV